MNKQSKTRKRISMALILCLCMALVVGSFAFFTDKLTANTTATAGNINLMFIDKSTGTAGSNCEYAVPNAWIMHDVLASDKYMCPGDHFNLNYALHSNSSKSMDVRQRIVLESSIPLTANAEEYTLTITGGADATAVQPTKEGDNKLIYDLSDVIINGTREQEPGATGGNYNVQLNFDRMSRNVFMDSVVTIDLYAAAKQHRNTEDADFPAFTEMASIVHNPNIETVPDI